jgi:hypothetical protein
MVQMVVGFNHNFCYKGEVYHIQTEDSGLKSPNIVTLLYQGGTILASKKTSYADITKVDNLNKIVEELMKEQHKEMLRRLKAGEFDAVIERFHARRQGAGQDAGDVKDKAPSVAEPPAAATQPSMCPVTAPAAPVVQRPQPKPLPEAAAKPSPPAAPAAKPPSSTVKLSLDDMILSYLFPEVDDK